MRVLSAITTCLLVACAERPADPPAGASARGRTPAERVVPPMNADSAIDDVWAYLATKYDADGDRRITPGEYDREERGFQRLDRDRDGAVTESDFAERGDDRSRMAILRYFQADGDPGAIDRAELERAARECDSDGDGRISPAEFEADRARSGEPAPDPLWDMMMAARPGVSPFEILLRDVDTDGDGSLGTAELLAYYDANPEVEGEWRPPIWHAPGGVARGEWAPDFTLSPPDGGAPVTLSSFRGVRPVALLFGSYT